VTRGVLIHPGSPLGDSGYTAVMDTPQQPELHRSGHSAADPEAVKATASTTPGKSTGSRQVPEDSRPGHHPDHEQDKPDLDKFARALGTVDSEDEAADQERPPADAPNDLPPTPDQPAEGGVATVEEALRNQGLAGTDD
jgi:hypothetical protein